MENGPVRHPAAQRRQEQQNQQAGEQPPAQQQQQPAQQQQQQPAQQQQPQQQPSRLGVTCLLEFSNPRIEAAYQHYMYKMQQAADLCVIFVNLFAVSVAFAKQFMLPASTGPSTGALCAISGSQSLALLLLLLVYPRVYAQHRGVIVGCTRMYRLVVWLLYLREPYPARLFRDNLSLRLFLLSPASGSVWLALFYPLPMSLHLLLLALSSFVAVCRTDSLEHRLQRLDASPEHLTQTYQRLSRFSRFLEMPSGRLLQRWPGAVLSESDRVWCMYAFVTLVYGLLLPLLLLYVKEVHFRVRFLSCLRPAVSEVQLGRLRNSLYSTTTSACFLFITVVPCAWSLVQLASRYLVVQHGRMQVEGVLFLLTVLSLEVFMRFWLLAVVQLLLHRVVRPALLWLLLRLTGRQVQVQGPTAAAGPGPAPGAAAVAGPLGG